MSGLSAPFPWFGGKSLIAAQVWEALGNVDHYVEPFFGSGAVLLARPHAAKCETVNDLDGFLSNFWRAVRSAPDEVAHHADWPVNEADLHARHLWLVAKRCDLTERLMGDPDYFDAKAAGWWVWGACAWIGGGWCSGNGPWASIDGKMVDSRQLPHLSGAQGINRKLPHLSGAQGINRQLPHLSGAQGINRKLPHLSGAQGINRKLPHLSGAQGERIADWFSALATRLRDVRVACGEWDRVTGPSVLGAGGGICGVFLDPPYSIEERAAVYAMETDTASAAREWCAENGDNPELRIVLAGYDGEHNMLEDAGWRAVSWKAKGGYGSQGETRGRENASRERLWLSPHCFGVKPDLFAGLTS